MCNTSDKSIDISCKYVNLFAFAQSGVQGFDLVRLYSVAAMFQ